MSFCIRINVWYIELRQRGDILYKGYKFRFYSNNEQKSLIHKTFGCKRFAYNYFLDNCMKNGYKNEFAMCIKLKELHSDFPYQG